MKSISLIESLRRPDGTYKPMEKRSKWSWARYWQHENSRRRGFIARDHRTQEERDRATLNMYDWAVAMMAEEAHAARVAKAQATLQYRAGKHKRSD